MKTFCTLIAQERKQAPLTKVSISFAATSNIRKINSIQIFWPAITYRIMQFYKPRNWARSIQPKISVSPIHIWKPWIDWMRVLDQNDKISDYLIRKSNLISSEDGENQNEKKNHYHILLPKCQYKTSKSSIHFKNLNVGIQFNSKQYC